ncbi:MAG: methenyltetrahydrofolate cyclohydrolase /5,10-methylenetetrahydrofolate dehydrogenase (NADP+) [Candidatus Kentron sp. G]|nr:MAG: methenyltetrahydrofolate cyclohydrolase /5,10-methylenetetrahydrofolate dehydrogenase (NADP+) [Candidatus Kentron sp. G]VFM99530.1 MAG: methenyltetrahydrofolate cyclohydrolase /5,10-methylenetetrahydrofolate dehydrogenase (NADP+) [Candidatus Kentron sp. G]VFN04488.1 MAG: methenyltetrahydrofolate cyclohydrolase /5,10-methylenetetrahydrofolate dehydrogenase (NADP+) [Candidatus Kentron sp. G]
MSAQLLDGIATAKNILTSLRERIALRVEAGRSRPGLAVILAGNDSASQIYVRNKRHACERTGIHSVAYDLPTSTQTNEILAIIDTLNEDPEIHGILVQLPLPRHIDSEALIERIAPTKDVDGFHPYNVGRLALGIPHVRPCTPGGIMTLLEKTGEPLKGRDAVIVGHSPIVGRPMLLALLAAECTVTICHRETRDLASKVKRAQILVVSVGKPGLIPGAWIREGAIVVDVGINRLEGGKIVGDVVFEAARERAAWITPVPGGVGPMTVATLLANTVQAAERGSAHGS